MSWDISGILSLVITVTTSSTIMLSMLYYVVLSVPMPVICTLTGTILVPVMFYIKSLVQNMGSPPTLYYMDSALAQYVLQRCKRLTAPYSPPIWATSTHVQTVLPLILPKPQFHYEREYLQMKDKGIIALDWGISDISKLHKCCPVLLVLPGLTGDASGMAFLCKRAVQKGFRPVVFNKRGHGDTPLTTPKLQSFGDPSDFRQAVKYIRSLHTGSRLVAVGSSAGSGLLVSYLGEYGSSSYLSASVCISAGYDICELFQKNTIRPPYGFLLLTGLKRLLARHASALAGVINIPAALRSKTLQQFDEQVYCKLYNISDLEQYWERNNPMRDIDDVCTPVLCISSMDDPVCVKRNIPFELFSLYPNFMLAATEHGGHCGFVERGTLENWADKVALEYLWATLEFLDQNEQLR